MWYDEDIGDFLDGVDIDGKSASGEPKISDAVTYGPKFVKLFNEFEKHIGQKIDTSRHLFALCLDHLHAYANWARESTHSLNFIRQTLMNHDYLRCEARNGLIFTMIYSFAAVKGVELNSDMFLTLADPVTGLGIVNKFSLKVYNDPFYFLSFLKCSVSGLIQAGAIPDNARMNQQRRIQLELNKEELVGFNGIKQVIVQTLDRGNVPVALDYIKAITNVWEQKLKGARSKRFVYGQSLLHMLVEGIPLAVAENTLFGGPSSAPSSLSVPSSSSLHETASASACSTGGTPRDSPPTTSASAVDNTGQGRKRQRVEFVATNTPIYTLKFERYGALQWRVQPNLLFDLNSILYGPAGAKFSSAYLIDETKLPAVEPLSSCSASISASDATGPPEGISPLPTATVSLRVSHPTQPAALSCQLEAAGALIKHWNKDELYQLHEFLSHFQTSGSDSTIANFWISHISTNPSSPVRCAGRGTFVYEVVREVRIVVRSCPAIGLSEPVWGIFFPEDLDAALDAPSGQAADSEGLADGGVPFFVLLERLLPQLKPVFRRRPDSLCDVIATYCPHEVATPGADDLPTFHDSCRPPSSTDARSYRTIGHLKQPARALLARFAQSNCFHDICLSYISAADTAHKPLASYTK